MEAHGSIPEINPCCSATLGRIIRLEVCPVNKSARFSQEPSSTAWSLEIKKHVLSLNLLSTAPLKFADSWCHMPSPRHSSFLSFQGDCHQEIFMKLWINENLKSWPARSFLFSNNIFIKQLCPQYFIKIDRCYAKISALKSFQFIKMSSKYRRN